MANCKLCKCRPAIEHQAFCSICEQERHEFFRKFIAPPEPHHFGRVWRLDNVGLVVLGLGFGLFAIVSLL